VDPWPFGKNFGYGLLSALQGLYSPYDAKVVGDYTGLTPRSNPTTTGALTDEDANSVMASVLEKGVSS